MVFRGAQVQIDIDNFLRDAVFPIALLLSLGGLDQTFLQLVPFAYFYFLQADLRIPLLLLLVILRKFLLPLLILLMLPLFLENLLIVLVQFDLVLLVVLDFAKDLAHRLRVSLQNLFPNNNNNWTANLIAYLFCGPCIGLVDSIQGQKHQCKWEMENEGHKYSQRSVLAELVDQVTLHEDVVKKGCQ